MKRVAIAALFGPALARRLNEGARDGMRWERRARGRRPRPRSIASTTRQKGAAGGVAVAVGTTAGAHVGSVAPRARLPATVDHGWQAYMPADFQPCAVHVQ